VRTLPGGRTIATWDGGALASFTARGRRIGAFPRLPADLAAPAGDGIAVLRNVVDIDPHVTLQRVDATGQAVTAPLPVTDASREDWRPEALLDAGDATFIVGRLEKRDGGTFVVVVRLSHSGVPELAFELPARMDPVAAVRPDGGIDLVVRTERHTVRLVSRPGRRDRRLAVGRDLVPVALQRDRGGRLLLALAGLRRGVLVRLRGDGSLDRSFPRLRFAGPITALALDGRGRILVAARGPGFATVRRFARDGAPDPAFGRAVIRRPRWTDSFVASLLADQAGRVLAAGSANDRPLLVRIQG
jgi:hypothetical protein